MDFAEARDSEWQWHQLGHMQVCTWLQTDNHTSTTPLSFLQAGCPSCRPTNSVKALKAAKLVTALLNYCEGNCGPGGMKWQPTAGFMTHVTCRLTAKNRDQLRNPTIDLVTPLMCVCVCVCLCARLSSGMLQPGNGSRLGVPNILLIITDGQSDHPPLSWTEAIEARRQGISVIAVSSRSVHTLHTALHTHSSRAHSLTQSVLVSPMPWRIAPPPVRGPERYF